MSKLIDHQSSFLYHVTRLIDFAYTCGFQVTGGELERTKEQQEIYVKAGKSKTMNSMHLSRLAIDLHFYKDGKWINDKTSLQSIGDYWEALDPFNSWGGNWESFTDCPHFQRTISNINLDK